MKKGLLHFLLYFLLPAVLSAQSDVVHQSIFSKKDGLAIDNISALAFDTDGFLWLGGEKVDVRNITSPNKGMVIQRFNGQMFHNIPLPNDGPRITEVKHILKRGDGLFYVSVITEMGDNLFLFDPYTATFTRLKIASQSKEGISLSKIVFYDGRDYLLVQEVGTLYLKVVKEDNSLETVFSYAGLDEIFAFDGSTELILTKNYIAIGDDNFPIMFFDWEGNLLRRLSADSFNRERDILVSKFYMEFYFKERDTVFTFIKNRKQLHYFDFEKLDVVPLTDSRFSLNPKGRELYRDKQGKILIIANESDSYKCYTKEKNGFNVRAQISGLDQESSVKMIADDVSEGVWLGLSNKELRYIQFPSDKIKSYLSGSALRTIKQIDSVNYLVATDTDGWFKMNSQTEEFEPYYLKENGAPYKPVYNCNIFEDESNYWSSSWSSILKIDKRTRETQAFRHFPVNVMAMPNDSSIVYGTKGYNLMHFDTRTYEHKALLKTDTLEIYGVSFKPDSETAVLGTTRGIITFNLATQETKVLGPDKLEDAFIIMGMYDEEHGFLFGTREGHLLQFNPETMQTNIVYKDELNSPIATVLFDDNGLWWINTFNGMVAFNPETKETTRYATKDGLSNKEANRHSALKTDSGFFLGTIDGLNFFNPETLKREEVACDLVPLRMRFFDAQKKDYVEVVDRSAFAKAKKINLPAENRVFDFDFGLTNVVVGRNESYRYRLNESDWITLGQSPQLRFPSLSTGNHNLEIEAIDFSGNKIGAPLFVEIEAQEFFYKTWWFYLLLTISSISFLVWLLYQYKERSEMQEKFARGLLASQEQERNRIAKELHDSIGQQLTLIKQNAQNQNQTEIAGLTNQTLNEVRSISRGLYPALLSQLGLSESIEQLLLEVDEQTSLFVSADIDEVDLYFNSESALIFYRFIQESITNVIKHSNAKTLSVVVAKEGLNIVTTIQDNGDGFDTEDKLKRNSLGMKTLEERIKILRGTLKIDSRKGQGTTIFSEIPVTK
ncbi:sensor histidine kinase [Dokdonia sinensis]|uniref:histidine kinase n=1 Tax=Dokdonia sinensis TaxID=2479847 RepID=A0A3M0FZE5_9FLAO|nr:sensor histidine kinase [Dokdonia sinensis]RMB58044.1 sensor histidine kinase [Dokdonia sinensis]